MDVSWYKNSIFAATNDIYNDSTHTESHLACTANSSYTVHLACTAHSSYTAHLACTEPYAACAVNICSSII